MKKESKTHNIVWILGILALAAFAVVCGLALQAEVGQKPRPTMRIQRLNSGWTIAAEGEKFTRSVQLPWNMPTQCSSVTLSRYLTPEQSNSKMLQFPTNRQGVQVYRDDELLYQVNTTSFSKIVMIKNDVALKLPTVEEPYTLRIVYSNLSDGQCRIPDILYGSKYDVVMHVIASQAVTVVSIVVLFVLMIFMLIVVGYFLVKRVFNKQILCLAAFLLTLIGWTLTDSPLAAISLIPLEYCGLICFYCLMLLPQTIVMFIIAVLDKRQSLMNFLAILIFSNIIAQSCLSIFGILPLNKMLYATHATLFLTIGVGLYCIIQNRREHPEQHSNALFYGLILMSAVAGASAVTYWMGQAEAYRIIMLLGTSVFFLIQTVGILLSYNRELRETRTKITELEMFERFSHIDALTGLGNRRAFEEKLSEIEHKLSPTKDALLFMLDLNGLKYTNDSYGHAAGDELIASAGCCIREAFGNGGSCFRIGGDEFAVLLPEATNAEEYNARLVEAIRKINNGAAVKLSIARGSSHLLLPNGERKTMSNWKQEADVNMYMNKTAHRREVVSDDEQEMRDIIACVVAAVEARDVYTANHSNRVSEISGLIARRMGLSPKTVGMVREAALLHDIGKIAVPDNILRKESNLSDQEYEIIKRHAVLGGEIIAKAKSMEEIACVITHHHEKFDGTGYPDGLSEQNIPLGARIIAVADSIDAMTSERSYRHAMTLDRCRQEILNNMGRAYDPAIVKIAMDSWPDIENIVMLHSKYLPHLGNIDGM